MNFRVLLIAVASSLLALGCSERQRIPTAFVGTWQSDEALTLDSLGESESASSADIDAFTNEFFGNRVMVYKPYEFTAYWVGDEWNDIAQEEYWLRYDIVDSGSDFVTLRYAATEYTESEVKTWRVEGDMIYVELPQWDFREYYRRIDE